MAKSGIWVHMRHQSAKQVDLSTLTELFEVIRAEQKALARINAMHKTKIRVQAPLGEFQTYFAATNKDQNQVDDELVRHFMGERSYNLWRVVDMLHGEGWWGPKGYSDEEHGPYACMDCVEDMLSGYESARQGMTNPADVYYEISHWMSAAIERCNREGHQSETTSGH